MNVVEVEYARITSLLSKTNSDLESQTNLGEMLPKHLLLAAASYLEYQMMAAIENNFESCWGEHSNYWTFVKRQGFTKSFYKLFEIKNHSDTKFLASFGIENWRDQIRANFESEIEYDQVKMDFFKILDIRNDLVHNNYANGKIEFTVSDIIGKFRNAEKFVEGINRYLNSVKSVT